MASSNRGFQSESARTAAAADSCPRPPSSSTTSGPVQDPDATRAASRAILVTMHKLLCALIGAALFGTALARDNSVGTVPAAQLPEEARATLRLIDAGGPFPYRRDGIAFQNRERRLPEQPKGYYREYTVPTSGSKDRGARVGEWHGIIWNA